MNWVFTHQGEDLIKEGDNYYEWDKQYSHYKLIPKKSFESWLGYEEYDDTSQTWIYGDWYGKEGEFADIETMHQDEEIDYEGKTIGQLEGEGEFGSEPFGREKWESMTPDAAADYIFDTKYRGTVPKGFDDEYSFKEELKRNLHEFSPRMGKPSEEELEFAGMGRDRDIYKLSTQAGQIGQAMRGVYGGSSMSMRQGLAGQGAMSKGFDFAQQDYKKDMYKLSEKYEDKWKKEYMSMLDYLPDAST